MEELSYKCSMLVDSILLLIQQIRNNYDEMLELYVKNKQTSLQRVMDLAVHCKTQASQRTSEWYSRRNACVTASDIGTILGKNKYKKAIEVLKEKCGERTFFGNKYTEWGNKFEPLATRIYEQLFNVKIYEASLLIHQVYPFIGASCDGFVVDEANNEGYLIEIKCPLSRKPNGDIPRHYWEQPQTQMEVCKVNKCVFFDCAFKEYASEAEYNSEEENKPIAKGMILEYSFLDVNNEKKYGCLYCDPAIPEKEKKYELLTAKFNKIQQEHQAQIIIMSRMIYWKLVDYTRVELVRDRNWFKNSLSYLKYFWDLISETRLTGEDPKKIKILNNS